MSRSNRAQPLTERYRPETVADFAGLDKPRAVLKAFLLAPTESSWIFHGPPGVGKTTMALALAEDLPAEFHHIPSRRADLAAIEEIARVCWYAPMRGEFHLVLIDEADQMTQPAQLALLSKLDATAAPPSTIFVFTANATAGLEDRFLSRCRTLEFSSYGIAQAATDLLARVWSKEAPKTAPAPNFARIVKDSTNNIRDALNRLEIELLVARMAGEPAA